jgi:hypothetical protein
VCARRAFCSTRERAGDWVRIGPRDRGHVLFFSMATVDHPAPLRSDVGSEWGGVNGVSVVAVSQTCGYFKLPLATTPVVGDVVETDRGLGLVAVPRLGRRIECHRWRGVAATRQCAGVALCCA